MAEKFIDGFRDDNNNPMPLSGASVKDKASGQTFTQHLADSTAHPTQEAIQELIETSLVPLQTTLNTFLSGDPDDNGTIDRLKELVAAIEANKDNIDMVLDLNAAGTGIAFMTDSDEEPEYSGKLRIIVSEMPEE